MTRPLLIEVERGAAAASLRVDGVLVRQLEAERAGELENLAARLRAAQLTSDLASDRDAHDWLRHQLGGAFGDLAATALLAMQRDAEARQRRQALRTLAAAARCGNCGAVYPAGTSDGRCDDCSAQLEVVDAGGCAPPVLAAPANAAAAFCCGGDDKCSGERCECHRLRHELAASTATALEQLDRVQRVGARLDQRLRALAAQLLGVEVDGPGVPLAALERCAAALRGRTLADCIGDRARLDAALERLRRYRELREPLPSYRELVELLTGAPAPQSILAAPAPAVPGDHADAVGGLPLIVDQAVPGDRQRCPDATPGQAVDLLGIGAPAAGGPRLRLVSPPGAAGGVLPPDVAARARWRDDDAPGAA